MKDYYEDVWERLPAKLEPPELPRRREFLMRDLPPGVRVLDLGCGEGTFTALLADAGAQPIGVEIAEAAITRARAHHPRLEFRLAPIDGRLPLDDAEVELVWASEVIEHVGDTAAWLSEIRRVLAPGGTLRLTTPHHPRLGVVLHGLERYSPPLGDHLHLYTRRSLDRLLSESGFGEVNVRAVGGVPLLRRLLLAQARR